MSMDDDIKQAIEGLEGMVAQGLYGSTADDIGVVDINDSTVGNDIQISDNISGGYSSGGIIVDPNGLSGIGSGDVVFSGGASTWGSLVVQAGPWTLEGKDNGDLEIIFETKDKRVEYHIEHEQVIAMLEKVAAVKVEGKEESDYT